MADEIIKWFNQISMNDLPLVGGKNASLGEMITHLSKLGLQVPEGFALTTTAYRNFIKDNHLDKLKNELKHINLDNTSDLEEKSEKIQKQILNAKLSSDIVQEINKAYHKLVEKFGKNVSVAIRSSANAEDLPDISFAGQQETYLNVSGIENVINAIIKVYASLYTARAISYRALNKVPEENIAMSVGIQRMIRSDKACSGVIFTLDTESGFNKVVFINACLGLGELLVQGVVNPDEFYVFKPSLSQGKNGIIRKKIGNKHQKLIFDTEAKQGTKLVPVSEQEANQFSLSNDEILKLAKQACMIEDHYQKPMDIEWAKDGDTNELYILQSRPETVTVRAKKSAFEIFKLKESGNILATGRSVGHGLGQGKARVILSIKDIDKIKKNDVLITDMTDPDWEPVMSKLSAIVTNRGGRTCHAAIVARELGIPAVIGTETATQDIKNEENITVSCAQGDTGYVYQGLLKYERESIDTTHIATLPVKIMINIANPDLAFEVQYLPNDGVGLARLEFTIAQIIGIHPKACLEFNTLKEDLKSEILQKTKGYSTPEKFYLDKLIEGISTITAAFWPKPVIIRLSDFKSNEYSNLLGGEQFEPHEENPMIGFRGASRYISDRFKNCFALECKAIKYIREEMGLNNLEVLVPFVRTVNEAKAVVAALKEQGLERGIKGLKLIMMCEVPSNIILAEQFLEYFDGYSIGSNDLTQLTLGIDRDSELLSKQFDERDPAILNSLAEVIEICKKLNKSVGICGQGPSDYPEFADWLIKHGIDSVSLNPDTVLSTSLRISKEDFKEG